MTFEKLPQTASRLATAGAVVFGLLAFSASNYGQTMAASESPPPKSHERGRQGRSLRGE